MASQNYLRRAYFYENTSRFLGGSNYEIVLKENSVLGQLHVRRL